MRNIQTVKILIKSVLFISVLLVFSSCSQNRQKHSVVNKTSDKIIAPQVTLLANLPDSSKPVTVFVEKAQKPKIIFSTKPSTVHSFIDSITHTTIAPEAQGIASFTNFTTDQGLALDGIYSSTMDQKGNLWFGTNGGGVSRYDGKTFTNYTISNGLAHNIVTCIVEDKNGNLWFGTQGGVSRYNGKSFKNYTAAQGLSNNKVFCIFEDKMENLWFGTPTGLSRFDGKGFTNYTTEQGLANNIVMSIKEDMSGNLWFGTDGGGVSRFDGERFTNYTTAQGLANNRVSSITKDKMGNLWFGTAGGISRFDGKRFTNYTISNGLAHNFVLCSVEDNKGNLWFGTPDGVSRYDGISFTNYTAAQGLSNNIVICIVEDKTGNLWFGTGGGGVSLYEGKSFINYTTAHGLADNLIWGIVEDKKGNLWFGSNKGATRYDGKGFSIYTRGQGLVSNFINCITVDRIGNLWFGTGDGVSKFDGKSFTNYTIAQGLKNNYVSCITVDRIGNPWFGTGDGVSKFDGKSFTNYTITQGLKNNYVSCITEDKKGNLWFGTYGGVVCFDGKSFTNYTTAQGLANNVVLYITEDKKGNLWFGTMGGGVSRYDGKDFTTYTTAHGLPDNGVSNIVIDSENIIFGTNSGLGILVYFAENPTGEQIGKAIPAQNSLSNEDLKKYTPHFEIYNSSTGYPVKELNGMSMIKDSKGIIWVGTGADKTALVRFDYPAVHRSSDTPVIMLQNIKVNNERICWHDLLPASTREEFNSDTNTVAPNITEEITTLGKVLGNADRDAMRSKFAGIKFDSITWFYPIPHNLILPYYHNNVTFDFAAIETSRPYLVKYQYFLEGYEKEWSPPGNKTSATYGNISEGTYSFKFKAQSPFGIWSKPITYTFKVLPPWWRTWWAYTLYLLVFSIALWSFIRWRMSALKKEKILLEEKITTRTHELQEQKEKVESTLSELRSSQSQLIQSEKMASLGELTAGIAHEIQNPLNFVNNFSEVNKEMIAEMKDEIDKGNYSEAKIIANDIEANEEKINHHGKRADAIVKGMLQHSRSTSGQKEPTDINKLVDEYLRLAYHGLRAKDKSFNATLKTDYDNTIGNINIIPQDIGRVILNLINNAFYAVDEKKKQGSNGYEPIISLSTKKITDKVEITIRDNGNGIPQNVVDKIFQPFFTTKPTGQGTGLGLSLSYDIIKAHSGQIKVETREGEGTAFIIELGV